MAIALHAFFFKNNTSKDAKESLFIIASENLTKNLRFLQAIIPIFVIFGTSRGLVVPLFLFANFGIQGLICS